jgi:hypothetical protein
MKRGRAILVFIFLLTGFNIAAEEFKTVQGAFKASPAGPPLLVHVICDFAPSGLTISCTDYCGATKNACLKFGAPIGGTSCNIGDSLCCGGCEELCKEACHEQYVNTYCPNLYPFCTSPTCVLPAKCQGTYETENAYGKIVYRPALESPECKNSPGYQTYLQCTHTAADCNANNAKLEDCMDFYK